MPVQDIGPSTLKRIRALSRPIAILLTVALGLMVAVRAAQVAALLAGFHHGDDWQGLASFSEAGFSLFVFKGPVPPLTGVPVETLDLSQRFEVAALAAACLACSALALFNLRQLFALYSRGEVFASGAVRRMKGFALWLVLAAIAANVSGRLFAALTGTAANAPANVLLTVFWGVAVYVIAHVMQLACEADQERREFV